jgi:hypothetical protein
MLASPGFLFSPRRSARMSNTAKEKIGLTEIARILGVSRNSAYLYARCGDIKGAEFIAGLVWVAPRGSVLEFSSTQLPSAFEPSSLTRSTVQSPTPTTSGRRRADVAFPEGVRLLRANTLLTQLRYCFATLSQVGSRNVYVRTTPA